jgi:hypothetical protein
LARFIFSLLLRRSWLLFSASWDQFLLSMAHFLFLFLNWFSYFQKGVHSDQTTLQIVERSVSFIHRIRRWRQPNIIRWVSSLFYYSSTVQYIVSLCWKPDDIVMCTRAQLRNLITARIWHGDENHFARQNV